jgi:hypothetical protein
MSSNLEPEVKKSLARNAQLQLTRVENKIRQIRRRERAEAEEKRDRRTEQDREETRREERLREERRRRRQHDLRPRSMRVNNGWLYPARDGGFCPYRMAGQNGAVPASDAFGAGPAVSFSVGGHTGFVDTGAGVTADLVNVLL